MFCKKCGNEIADGARFCRHCGNPVELNNTETTVLGQQTPPVSSVNGETTVLGNQQANVIEQPQPQAAYEQPIYQQAPAEGAYQPPVQQQPAPAKKKLSGVQIALIVIAFLVVLFLVVLVVPNPLRNVIRGFFIRIFYYIANYIENLFYSIF